MYLLSHCERKRSNPGIWYRKDCFGTACLAMTMRARHCKRKRQQSHCLRQHIMKYIFYLDNYIAILILLKS